jgi:uncharacterized membrane protein YphA (DoxX/SURF4 family)
MATITSNYVSPVPATTSRTDRVVAILHWTYGLLAIAAGADKFMHLLTDWTKYLAPVVTRVVPVTADAFMKIVGVIEIIAGILVLVKPKVGSLIVACWLIGIAINLLLTGQYFDIAVRDTVMAIGAFCLHLLINNKKEAA